MRRAALYIRVSTLEQAQEGYSVGEQRERLIAYCKAQDWLIADIYVDGGYTGSNLNRPGIQKLMSETEKFDVVLVYKLDRLSRSQRDTLYLIEEIFRPNKVDFVSMQESFDTSSPFGKAMIGLLAVFAQLEREQIKERTWMGRVARAKTGLHHGGGNIPIGYDYEDGKLIVNPYEAEQVRKIYEWYLSGASLKAITDKLQDAGYTNKYSSYNSWSSVRNILENETYIGRLHFGGVVVDHAHEAIITEEQFNAAQILRGKRREQFGSHAFQSKHVLTGLLFCGHCGGRYYLRNTGKYSYYACYSRTKQMKNMIKDPNCQNKIWRAQDLEPIIEEKILALLRNPQIAEELAADTFVELLIHKKRFLGNSDFKTYLYSIGRHKALDYIRRDAKKKTVPTDEILELSDEAQRIEEDYIADESRRALHCAIGKLSEDARAAVYLVFFEELSYEDAARVLGKNKKQIDNLVYRAKATLKKILTEEGISHAQ